MHLSLKHGVCPIDALLAAPASPLKTTISRTGKVDHANTAPVTTTTAASATVEILNDVSPSMREQLMGSVVDMFRTVCTSQTQYLQKLFPNASASVNSGRKGNVGRSQSLAITLSHIVVLLQILVQLLPAGHDSPASQVPHKQLQTLRALKDKLLQLLYKYLPQLANKETAKDESGIFLLMSVLRFHSADLLAEVSASPLSEKGIRQLFFSFNILVDSGVVSSIVHVMSAKTHVKSHLVRAGKRGSRFDQDLVPGSDAAVPRPRAPQYGRGKTRGG